VRDGSLHVAVTDTGVGVPPEDRERIFESFQQGGRGTTREEGTGLGLTLTKRIVDLFGGRLWLDTAVGVGSTFGFSIPVDRSTGDLAAHEGGARPVLLLVDDDRASLDLVTAYLEGAGVDIVRARDGEEALDQARHLLPAAVILDIRLPKLDGWEVLKVLKADPATAAIPVVVVSILDEPSRGLGLGAAGYLTKPLRREGLLKALRGVGLPLDDVEHPVSATGGVAP
jgi:CheY-like chemotaxis protein